jgi:hypothetical protein
MRKVTVETLEAFDKSTHPNEDACIEYERTALMALAQLDPYFADTVESVGMALRKARQGRGELRRASPKKAEPAKEPANA